MATFDFSASAWRQRAWKSRARSWSCPSHVERSKLSGIRATARGEERPRELLVRTEWDGGDYVRTNMADSGVGFDPESDQRLFEAFYSTKRDEVGVGLSVSRAIVEKHQGRLWALLNDGPGATFLFRLPCHSLPASSAR